MKIISQPQIAALEDRPAIMAAVRQALIDHANGLVTLPLPLHLGFHDGAGKLTGDCHVKAVARKGSAVFAIKTATGFYGNPARGLEVNNGAMLVFDATTGEVLTILNDGGLLTSWRTAAAGALAAGLVKCGESDIIAIAGTGHQAELQALWACEATGLSNVRIWGRSGDRAQACANRLSDAGINATTAPDVRALCEGAQILITATSSTEPFMTADDVTGPLHIIAVGADDPHKAEIAPDIVAQAKTVLTDDHEQCLASGDFGRAVKAGLVDSGADMNFGKQISGDLAPLPHDGVTLVDLTGLGAQDLAMAEFVWNRLDSD